MTSLYDELNSQRKWLAQQPRFDNWSEGCEWLAASCGRWVATYFPRPFGDVSSSEDLQIRCEARLWRTWAHHWREARARLNREVIDGLEVAQSLRRGIRPGTATLMGGDPLRDSVFVEIAPVCAKQAWSYLLR